MICWPRGIAVATILGFGAIALINTATHAEPGVFDDRILFGQSAAFEGPAAALGLGMREGSPSTKPTSPAELTVAGLSWSPTTTGTSRKRRLPTPST